jgi:hypothetical protein
MLKAMVLATYVLVMFFCSVVHAGPSIVISQIFYDTPGNDSKEEWIELFNSTALSVDIGGWELHDNSSSVYTFPLNTLLLPGQTFALARDLAGYGGVTGGLTPDLTGFSLSLNNSGDFLVLFDATSQLVDRVGWEGALVGWDLEAQTGESLTRIALGDDPGSWLGNQSPMPGTAPPTVPEPATVVLVGTGLAACHLVRRRKRHRSKSVHEE